MPLPRPASGSVVLETPGVRILDTRALDWEPHPAVQGARRKVLSRDADGRPVVMLTWFPPGMRHVPRVADPHWKDDVAEYGYVLSGELPMREYAGADDTEGIPVMLQAGHYIDRRPGSVHGVDRSVEQDVGFLWLQWYEWTGAGGPGSATAHTDVSVARPSGTASGAAA